MRHRDRRRGFAHPALFYQGPWEYRAGTVPFIREGLAADVPVAVASPPDPGCGCSATRWATDAERVQLAGHDRRGTQPGPDHRRSAAGRRDAHPGRHVRIIGEPIWPTRSEIEYPACVQHEALINVAFRGRRATILCPYDVAGLDPVVIADAAATHPTLIQRGRHGAARTMRRNASCPAQPATARTASTPAVLSFDAPRLCLARRAAAEHAETPAWTRNGSRT